MKESCLIIDEINSNREKLMSVSINTLSIAEATDANDVEVVLQSASLHKNEEPATPTQPLPGSDVSDNELWRSISNWLAVIDESMGGASKEAVAAKRQLIATQEKTTKDGIKDREAKLIEQKKAQENASIWDKIGMALGFLAAIIIAPFNPVASAIIVATIVAAIVLPVVADKIMEAAGVDKATRNWVKTGLEIGVSLLGAVLSFNPGGAAAAIGKAAAAGAAKVAAIAEKVMSAANSIKALSSISTKVGTAVEKMMKLVRPLLDKIKSLTTGAEQLASRTGQVVSVASDASAISGSAYGIKSAQIQKDEKKAEAEIDKITDILQQIMSMLNKVFLVFQHSLETKSQNDSDARDYFENVVSIHL